MISEQEEVVTFQISVHFHHIFEDVLGEVVLDKLLEKD